MMEPPQPERRQPGGDRRQAPRVVRGIILRYRAVGAQEPTWSASTLRDLSRIGARFIAEGAVEAGQRLDVQLVLPITPQALALQASVVWAKPMGAGLAEVGVRFILPDATTERLLDQSVAHFLQRAQRPPG